MRPPRRVLIVLPRWAHMLDVAGPAQAFTNASELGGAYELTYVADELSVPTHQGLHLSASSVWPALGVNDLVVVPGWKIERTRAPLSPSLMSRVREHWDRGGHVASICGGALLLAEAGILAGCQATTHHDLTGELAQYARVRVEQDLLYTCTGRLHTSAGIASGIDLSLHLISHDYGPALAARVARTLVVPVSRAGSQSQHSVLLEHRDHLDDVVHRAQDLLDDAGAPPLTLAALGTRLGVSGRTLARRFQVATGLTPHAYATAVRRDRAAALVIAGWTREAAAHAVGYADARSLRS